MLQQLKKHPYRILIVIIVSACVSCSRYYKAVKSTANSKTVDSLQNESRYFVLRSGSEAFHMTKIAISDDRQTLHCELDTLPQIHTLYLSHGRNGKMRYIPSQHDDVVLNEVHVFVNNSDSIHLGSFAVNLDQIKELEVITKDTKRTTTSYVLGGLGITAGVTAATVIIAVATYTPPAISYNGSCSPQVYTETKNKSELNGTLCSGAIYASLERTDYLPVNIVEKHTDKLSLILRGEKNEELMMKDFKLVQVSHSTGQKVLIDKNGHALVFKNPVAPEHAFISAGEDVVNDVNSVDEKYYSFTNEADGGGSSVILDFKKPMDASSGKLIVRGKNSNWAYYVFNEFKKLYGNHYQALLLKKDKQNPSSVLQCEIDQSLPLLVSVNDAGSWKLVDYFFTPGNAATRDLIMQLDLNEFKNQDHVQIKLQTAYRFWDIDYAAMDFSNDKPVSVSYIMPTQFYKSGNVSQTANFSRYNTSYTHILGDEQLHITFELKDNSDGTDNTYFLEGGGYYHDNTVFKGKPQLTELRKCSGKGAFDRFSRRKFEEALTASSHQQNDSKKDFEILK